MWPRKQSQVEIHMQYTCFMTLMFFKHVLDVEIHSISFSLTLMALFLPLFNHPTVENLTYDGGRLADVLYTKGVISPEEKKVWPTTYFF